MQFCNNKNICYNVYRVGNNFILNLYGGVDHLKKSRGGNIMKDFLEELEIGEGKVKLSKEEIKSILAKHGDYIKIETEKVDNKYKEQLEDNKTTISELKAQIEEAPKSDEMESLKRTIADMEAKEEKRLADEKAQKDDEMLTNNIIEAFGDKVFINEYTKNAIIDSIKSGLKEANNGGKSAKDLFEEITKDKSNIFANPNTLQDMESMGDSEENTNQKEMPILW